MRFVFSALAIAGLCVAQEPQTNGPRELDPGWHALVANAIHVKPGEVIRGTILLKDGKIVSVSPAPPPKGARVWRVDHVYAGLIDLYVEVDGDPHKQKHWNKKVKPERTATSISKSTAKELRDLGFTTAVASPKDGILRGHASLLSLQPKDQDVYADDVYEAVAFERFRGGKDGFPTSQMGSIAVLRQELFDGFAKDHMIAVNTTDELEAIRAWNAVKPFDIPLYLIGSGRELRRLEAIAKLDCPIILPIDFPDSPDVASVDAQIRADLRTLLFWEHAPFNPRLLHEAGVTIALTTAKLDKRKDFYKNLRRALDAGLTDETALSMLTTIPADMVEQEDSMGTIEAGKRANLTVVDGRLFDKKARIRAVWIDGKHTAIKAAKAMDLTGAWTVKTVPPGGAPAAMDIATGNKISLDGKSPAKKTRLVDNRLSFVNDGVAFSGIVADGGKSINGHGILANGDRFAWTATRGQNPAITLKKAADKEIPAAPELRLPYGPYGTLKMPPQVDKVLLRGATIWTSSSAAGIIENGDLLLGNGRILYVGPKKDHRKDHGDVTTIDCTGQHITPGIIDCHSHTGISKGVNDSGQQCTAEVRIGDVTNPDHISWYRQLASGVTTVNSLHGSANPIGGQSQTNKVRWGVTAPNDMHFAEAKPGIKFALGENVKQSNWGDDYRTRYPQTRMGVEAFMRDRFLAAREYAKKHERVDLELEALAEILAGKRLVHCHSYRQDEILMLARLAEEFGFKIGTYQHILEGYKVTDAIKKNAIGASTFSDWWAYKVEVQDAIPYNGPIMHDAGIVVSFNSDSDDLVRRLNTEAAKAIKYGGLKPEIAFRFVTINPAIQLGIDQYVGSLEVGKHADVAIWSGDPLSVYSRCVATWVDGRELFSLKKDAEHRAWIRKERSRLIAKVLADPKAAEKGKKTKSPDEAPKFYDCGECGR